MNRSAATCVTGGSTVRITARSHGVTCCSRPPSGRANCSASRRDRPQPQPRHGRQQPDQRTVSGITVAGWFWEYNDVRVNRLSLALLRLFRRPLPEVLAQRIMRPIGASDDWAWHGYWTSVVEIDGKMMEPSPAARIGAAGLRSMPRTRRGSGTDAEPRRLGWRAHPAGKLDTGVADPLRTARRVRIAVVAEHRRVAAECFTQQFFRGRRARGIRPGWIRRAGIVAVMGGSILRR